MLTFVTDMDLARCRDDHALERDSVYQGSPEGDDLRITVILNAGEIEQMLTALDSHPHEFPNVTIETTLVTLIQAMGPVYGFTKIRRVLDSAITFLSHLESDPDA